MATVFGLLLKQYEIPDWVIMILRQIFSGHFLDCFSGQSAEKESNLRFPFYSRPPMKKLKSTHNRFQHYKKNDINVALSFLPID